MRAVFALALLAGCAATTASFLESEEGYDVTKGYVVRLRDLHDPKIRKLKDGTAYTVTQPGCTVVLEVSNRNRREFELRPGDIFLQSRPLSYVMRKR